MRGLSGAFLSFFKTSRAYHCLRSYGDMVAVLGATTGQQALIKLRDRMRNDHEGYTILSRLQLQVQSPGPWALRNGSRARCVVSIFYERRWEQDLDELRHELNIEPPPVLLIPSSKNTFSNS